MASSMSDWLENKLIDHIFRGRSFTAPTNLYIALFTTTPSDTGGGTEVSASGTNYARVQIACSDTGWEATQGGTPAAASSGTGGHTQNPSAITFPAPGATAWGTINGMAVMDIATVGSGNVLFWADLATPKTVNGNDPAPSFAIGDLDITLA